MGWGEAPLIQPIPLPLNKGKGIKGMGLPDKKMRDIQASLITQTVARLCEQANFVLGEDVITALQKAEATEESPLARETLGQLLENARIAQEELRPLCQDCGTAVVFLEIGQEVHVVGGDLSSALAEGVRQGYSQGYLRRSIVSQPFSSGLQTVTPMSYRAQTRRISFSQNRWKIL